MYLLVFVILIIGLVGLYGQILSLQAARITASLNGFATTMAAWHGGALSMASAIIKSETAGMGGYTLPCSLTYALPAGVAGLARCLPGLAPASPVGTITNAADAPQKIDAVTNELVHMPPGYNYAQNQFYSIFYADAAKAHFYVVTFILPPTITANNPAPGFISLLQPNASGGGTRLGSYRMNDVYHQLTISGLPDFSYGTAQNGPTTSILLSPWYLQTGAAGAGVIQYNLPLSAANAPLLPPGTVAIVSSPP